MIAGEVLEAPNFVQLNGFEYQLLRGDLAEALERRTGVRRWKVTSRRLTTQINPSRNLRAGEIEGEWLLIIDGDDWKQGQSGGRGEPGQCLFAFYANSLNGYVAPVQDDPFSYSFTGETQGADPAVAVLFNNILFLIMGRYAYTIQNGTPAVDRDFGAGIFATDALVHNDEMIVAFGGATNRIQKRTTGGTWTTATDATYADHFGKVLDRLWRGTATNQVSNIGPTDNPFTLASWSAGISVGTAGIGISDLNGQSARLVVSKPEGMFLGDAAARFENALPQIALTPDVNNGKNTLVRGADIFYPHARGLLRRYENGKQEEIGLQLQVPFSDLSDPDALMPATRIRSLAAHGNYIYAACEYPGATWATTSVQVTTNNGASYSNETTTVTNGDLTSSIAMNLDTLANGDWIVIGVAATGVNKVIGFYFDGLNPNAVTATMLVQYWDGAAWQDITALSGRFRDGTATAGLSSPSSAPTATLSRSGYVLFPNATNSTAQTINTLNRRWYRVSFSALLTSTTAVGEIRAITLRNSPFAYAGCTLYRGRAAEPGDRTHQSIVWEPFSFVDSVYVPTTLLSYNERFYPYSAGGNIVVAAQQGAGFFPLAISTAHDYGDVGDLEGASYYVTPLLDGGQPNVNKQWTRIRIRSVFATQLTMTFATRTDDTAAWSANTTITSDDFAATLSAVSGRRISLRFGFDTALTTGNFPRILGVDLVYRTLDTYVEETEMVLLVADHQSASGGGELADAKTQITRLEALRGTAARTFVDPLRQTKTVTVFEMQELETYQFGQDMAGVAVQVRVVEE